MPGQGGVALGISHAERGVTVTNLDTIADIDEAILHAIKADAWDYVDQLLDARLALTS